jgi:tetratricopeptide (TPR) repeat protein
MLKPSPKTPKAKTHATDALLQQGMASHQRGQLAEAEAIYAKILQQEPRNANALHLSGVIALQRNQPQGAVAFISKAIQVNSAMPEFHCNLGTALKQLHQVEQALASYDKAIALNPRFADALSNRGSVLNKLHRAQDALVSIDKALTFKPDHAEAHFNRGNALRKLNRLEEAASSFKRAMELRPRYAEALSNLGSVLKQLGRFDDALACFDKAIALQPHRAEAHSNRGNVLAALMRPQEALVSYDRALVLDADFVEAHSNRGNVLNSLGRPKEALPSLDKALALNPNFPEAHSNRGAALSELGRIEEALACFEAATVLKPTFAQAHNNLGNTYLKLQRVDEALARYETALTLTPDFPEAQWNLAFALLLTGNFERGWALFESRRNVSAMQGMLNIRHFGEPLWLGAENLAGKTILLHAEQGLGDTLQFCRYAKDVKARGANVLLEVPAPLMGLLSGLAGVDLLIEKGKTLPVFDYQCPLLSLPYAFKTTLQTVPNAGPYLDSSPEKRRLWQQRLGTPMTPRIGLVWSGNSSHPNDRNRSVPLAEMLQCLPAGNQYVSLQKEVRESDMDALRDSGIAHFGADLADFEDTAALCSLMDMVISVDTSVAHLAGAMGKIIWVLLPCAPDWRWMRNRTDSPWYESAKLYRQSEIGQWAPVLKKIAKDLSNRA